MGTSKLKGERALLLLLLLRLHCLVAKEGEEDVVGDLDGVDVEESLAENGGQIRPDKKCQLGELPWWDESEVHGMGRNPDHPAASHRSHQVPEKDRRWIRQQRHGYGSGVYSLLDFVDDLSWGLALGQTQVREKHDAEARIPKGLIDRHLVVWKNNQISSTDTRGGTSLLIDLCMGGDLGCDGHGLGARELRIEESVEVVTSGAVNEQTEAAQTSSAGPVMLFLLLHELEPEV